MYQIDGFLKWAEEDNFEEGCNPDTSRTFMVDAKFTGKTIEDVINQAAKFLGISGNGIERNACDEKGRIDFAGMECDDSIPPSKHEMDEWKKGNLRLWSVVYTGNLERVTRVSA